jgi:hypothetical protein
MAIPGWDLKIAEAQEETTYIIGGIEYARIPYGSEADDWGADKQPCHDCKVIKGQFHVPGCDAERCPVCVGAHQRQVISCGCLE